MDDALILFVVEAGDGWFMIFVDAKASTLYPLGRGMSEPTVCFKRGVMSGREGYVLDVYHPQAD